MSNLINFIPFVWFYCMRNTPEQWISSWPCCHSNILFLPCVFSPQEPRRQSILQLGTEILSDQLIMVRLNQFSAGVTCGPKNVVLKPTKVFFNHTCLHLFETPSQKVSESPVPILCCSKIRTSSFEAKHFTSRRDLVSASISFCRKSWNWSWSSTLACHESFQGDVFSKKNRTLG